MKDSSKTKRELIEEGYFLKERIKELELSLAEGRHAEEALRRSEMKFRTLYDSTSDAVMLADENSFLDCNKATLAMYGCATHEEFCSICPADVSPPVQPCGIDSLTLSRRHMSTALETGRHQFEWIHKRADTGETFPAEVLLTAMVLDGRSVVQAVVRNITDRKRAEAALKESEESLRSLLNATNETLLLTDTEGTILAANEVLAQKLGKSIHELLGTSQYDYFPRDVARHRRRQYAKVISTGQPVRFEDERAEKSFEIFGYPVFDGGGKVSKIAIFARDITERKIAEEALMESEEKYRILVEKANEAIIIAQNGVFIYANRRMSDLLGIPASDLEGKPFIDFIWPEDRELAMENYSKRIAGETVRDDYDFRFIGPGGKPIWVLLSATAIQWKGKTATLNLMTDITDRKRIEEEKRHSEKLSTALEMAGAICHELNQPLQVIRGRVDLLSMESRDDRTSKTLEIINDQVQRMGIITKKLMGLKKYSNRDYVGTIKIADIDQTSEIDTQ